MVPLLKVATIGGVCIGALGCFWLITNTQGMPLYRDLSTDSDFENIYTSKYAADYSKYFVGVSDSAKANSKSSGIDNKDWWDWSFKNRYLTAKDGEIKEKFKNKNNGTDLKNICKEAYKIASDQVTKNASNDKYEESNVWAFCSIGGNKPKSISEVEGEKDSYTDNTYGKSETDNKLLISLKDEDSNWFWEIKEKEFFESETYLGENSDNSEFKTTYDQKEQYKNLTHMKVKELCEKAYKENATSSTSFSRKVVFKFCSLSGKEPNGSSK